MKNTTFSGAAPAGFPYERREALPISYFPFLSAEHDVPAAEALAFQRSLRRNSHEPGECLLYIHIPFCESICAFCGFYRKPLAEFSANLDGVLNAFTGNLVREIELWGACGLVQELKIGAVYVGGGTPSLLPPDHIDRLLGAIRSQLPVPPDVEFSFEGEVRSLRDRTKLALLKQHGVTRVSFGVQTFEPAIRKLCHLQAALSDIEDCTQAVRDHGYTVNIDLMYGLPGQTVENLERDLRHAAEDLGCSHIDLYDAILYPNTDFLNRRHFYSDVMPSDPMRVEMIRLGVSYLRSRGFAQITSDDFVLPGAEYRMKNLNFGGADGASSVLAAGPCAIGFLLGASYRNLGLEAYLGPRFAALPIGRVCHASEDELRRRPFVFLPKILRTDVSLLRYGVAPETERILLDQAARGLLARRGAAWELTDLGLEWVDAMAYEHLRPRERRRMFKIVQ